MASAQEKIEDVTNKKVGDEEESSSSDDEHDHDHDHHGHDHHGHDHGHEGHDHAHKGGDKKANKGEKKFKKAMTKFGMKPVTGINRVTIKKSKAFFLYIDDPEILKSPGVENTYVIFGEAKIQDFSNMNPGAADEEAKRFTAEKAVPTDKAAEGAEQKPAETKEESKGGADDEEGELNEEGLAADAIEMVMSHTKCTRRQAVKALRETNGDSVTAIINLT